MSEAKRLVGIRSDSVNSIIEIKIGREVDTETPGRIKTHKDLIMHGVGFFVWVNVYSLTLTMGS